MQFFKLSILSIALVISGFAISDNQEKTVSKNLFELPENHSENKDLPENAYLSEKYADQSWLRVNMEKQKVFTENMQKNKALDHFKSEAVSKQIKQYEAGGQLLASKTLDRLDDALQTHAGLSKEQASYFNNTNRGAQGTYEYEEKAIFISFSMPDYAIKDAIEEAKLAGAKIYLRGMHPTEKSINETMGRLRKLAKDIRNLPIAKFNPKAFGRFGVTQVPALLLRKNGKTALVKGLMNFDYLEEKITELDESETFKDFGEYGNTVAVIERDLLEEIQERIANLDEEKIKENAIKKFWSHQNMIEIPRATVNQSWSINPTVTVKSDIKNPRGDLLANRGQVLNPLSKFPTSQTLYIFDALDNKQLEWVSAQLKEKQTGSVMLISSRFHSEKSWEHLSALRSTFGREIYHLPDSMVKYYQIDGLPAKISTDLTNKVFNVSQFKVGE